MSNCSADSDGNVFIACTDSYWNLLGIHRFTYSHCHQLSSDATSNIAVETRRRSLPSEVI